MGRGRTLTWAFVALGAVLYLSLYATLSAGPTGDGFYTYLMVDSLVTDLDLDLANQFARAGNPWGYQPDPDTGFLRMRYEAWPLFVWAPLMLLGKLLASIAGALGLVGDPDKLVQTVTLAASPLAAILGVLALVKLLVRHVDRTVAWLAALGCIMSTQLVFYSLASPAYAHPLSFAFSALLLERLDAVTRSDDGPTLRESVVLGAILGALMNCRPQSAVFSLLLLWPLARALSRGKPLSWLGMRAGCMALSALACFAPTLLLFAHVYGSPFETFQGPHFMRWSQPELLAVWFSSAGGLFPYTPVAWLGIAGLVALARSAAFRVPALLMLLTFLVHSFVNACAWDYWGGATFGARRASELVAILAVGAAAVLVRALGWVVARPRAAFATLGGCLLALQLSLYTAASSAALEGELPLIGPTKFSQRARLITGRWARALERGLGDPFALPASLFFALRHDVPLWQYSCVVGRSFLEPSASDAQFHTRELLDFKRSEDRCLLAADFDRDEPSGAEGRLVKGRRGRVLLPVHTPTTLRLSVRYETKAACDVLVSWDGVLLGPLPASAQAEGTASLLVPESALASDVQELDFVTAQPSCLRVSALAFEPLP